MPLYLRGFYRFENLRHFFDALKSNGRSKRFEWPRRCAAYLAKLAGLFPGNPVAWIASYNAGEEAVGRWLKNGDSKDIEEWIEEIPYSETNLYVKKVLVSYWKYQRLY